MPAPQPRSFSLESRVYGSGLFFFYQYQGVGLYSHIYYSSSVARLVSNHNHTLPGLCGSFEASQQAKAFQRIAGWCTTQKKILWA